MLYRLSQIALITGGRLFGADRSVDSVATDSRNAVASSAIFVAISGLRNDGHNHIDELSQRGVCCFIVERLPDSAPEGCSLVVVENSLEALQRWAAYHRSKYEGSVIAITGSNGKTVVKEWFAQLWDSQKNGKLFRSPRSYNSQLGVALSLLMIEGDERVAFIEAGISQPGEMERLRQMIRPNVGVLTNIGDAHLQNFSSTAELESEKMLLFADCPLLIKADCTIQDINSQNLDLVLSIYRKLGLHHKPQQEIESLAMRLEIKEGINNSTIINDSYINDLASLTIALDYQNRLPKQRRVLIFSELEGGDYAQAAAIIARNNLDLFVGIGEGVFENRALFPTQSYFYKTTGDFFNLFDNKLISDSTILLKGSRKFAFEKISAHLSAKSHTTFMEVDLEQMAENLNRHRALLAKDCRTMAMVKANSYGSGSVEVAAMLERQKVDYLAVAYTDEGVTLRNGGIKTPIVVLNADPASYDAMVEANLEPEIYSLSSLLSFISTTRRYGLSSYPVHIKLDTGMHRLGFLENEIGELHKIISNQFYIKVASIFSHLAAADDPAQDEFTEGQIAKFRTMASELPAALWHICNSAGIERFPQAHFDMVRLGIGLYKDAISLKTRIVQIKNIAKDETIGYGRWGVAHKGMRLAILPIGYADGLNRRLGRGVGKVNVNGALCHIVGNVCMDTVMVDVSGVDCREGDEAVIFGNSPAVEQVAAWLDTISYEVLTSVSSRIKRVYIN